jgi:integrase
LFERKYPITIWKAMKKYLDSEYYPHLFRHISATYYAQNGVIGAGLKKRFGWAKETSAEPYVNLNDDYLLEKEYEISAKTKLVEPVEIKKEAIVNVVKEINKELVL